MNTHTTGHPVRPARASLLRRSVAGLSAAALTAGGLVALGVGASAPAAAASTPVTGATFTWEFNNEATSGAFAPGTWNLMSAGRIGDPGAGGATLTTASSGATWSTGAAAGWSASAGNVRVEDLQADGSYAPATFATTRTNTAGANANTSGVRGETRLAFGAGNGTLDPEAENASITWDGDATLLFYSGMTFFYVSDPELTVTGGTGAVTATVGGYATSMDDPTAWDALPETEVTLATLNGVDVTASGLTTTPAYAGVTYESSDDAVDQVRTGSSWGSFPQSFVDFQQDVGQGSYWYSSGGAADPRKVANPITVSIPTPTVSVSDTDVLPDGRHEVTVTGEGFDPTGVIATRPPLAGRSGGVYVAFGKYADVWRPSAGAPSSARKNVDVRWAVLAADMATVGGAPAGAVELTPAGTFSTTLVLDKAAADAAAAAGNYGIYTYPGGGASNAAYETATPVTFTPAPVTPAAAPAPAPGPTPAAQAPSSTTATATLAKKPTPRRSGKVRISVTTAGADLGTAKVVVRNARGTVVKKVKAAGLNGAGVAKVSIPRLAKGRYRVVTTYRGTATTKPAKTSMRFSVK